VTHCGSQEYFMGVFPAIFDHYINLKKPLFFLLNEIFSKAILIDFFKSNSGFYFEELGFNIF
jgi:hypothetical protein